MGLIRQIGVWAIALLLAGCQVIPEDQQLLPLPQRKPVSNALLVEFTGFLCVNCPTAAEEAQSLHETYPDNLVVVAMHPADNHFTQTTLPQYDYTCPEANVYYNYFGGTAATPFPTGTVDFQQGWQDYPSWGAAVRSSVIGEKDGEVTVAITELDAKQRSFCFSLVVGAGSTLEAQVLLWLVADSVQGAQQMPDGSSNMNYTHRHMLRASVLDDPWGWEFSLQGGADPIHTRIRDYVVTDTIGGEALPLERYSLVAVMLDKRTKQLLDVKQIKINNE